MKPLTKIQNMLINAAIDGDTALVKKLLDRGADPNFLDKRGESPLSRAAGWGHMETVKFLFSHGAWLDHPDAASTNLHGAAEGDRLDFVKFFLEHGAQIHALDSQGATPLHCAARYSQPDIVNFLIEKGADIHAKDNKGLTPLEWAVEGRFDKTFMLLLPKSKDHVLKKLVKNSAQISTPAFVEAIKKEISRRSFLRNLQSTTLELP